MVKLDIWMQMRDEGREKRHLDAIKAGERAARHQEGWRPTGKGHYLDLAGFLLALLLSSVFAMCVIVYVAEKLT